MVFRLCLLKNSLNPAFKAYTGDTEKEGVSVNLFRDLRRNAAKIVTIYMNLCKIGNHKEAMKSKREAALERARMWHAH